MKNILILILMAILFVGCMRRSNYEYIPLQPYTKMTLPYMYILTPSSYPKTPFKTSGIDSKETIYLHRTIPNMMSEDIKIYLWDLRKGSLGNRLLHKDTNKEFEEYYSNSLLSDWEISNHKETGINYYKEYTDFIGKLKCYTSVYSRNIANGIGGKSYGTSCPYYDTQGIAKELFIGYDFYYTFNRTKFEGSDNPSLARHKFEEIQLQFKKDMKEIFDSLVIYDMNKEQMQKNGLLYDKKYSLDNESKAIDKSMECTFIKKTDSFICIGKDTKRKCTQKRTAGLDKNGDYSKWKCEDIK